MHTNQHTALWNPSIQLSNYTQSDHKIYQDIEKQNPRSRNQSNYEQLMRINEFYILQEAIEQNPWRNWSNNW